MRYSIRVRHGFPWSRVLALACGLMLTVAATEPFAVDRTSGCRFLLPSGLDARGGVLWFGPCRAGLADGLGVLRTRPDLATPHVFMGEMLAGRPITGLVLGNRDAVLIAEDQPDRPAVEYNDVYARASMGAHAASEWFKARHNRGSATYYERLSDEYGSASE